MASAMVRRTLVIERAIRSKIKIASVPVCTTYWVFLCLNMQYLTDVVIVEILRIFAIPPHLFYLFAKK